MNLCYATGVQQRFVTKCTKLSKQWIALNKYNCAIVYAFDAFYFKRTNISSSLTKIDYQNIWLIYDYLEDSDYTLIGLHEDHYQSNDCL